MRTRRCGLRLRPLLDQLDARCLLSGLTPAQVLSAYGLDGISFTTPSGTRVKGDGSGQTIALIEAYHAPNLASDLHVFDQTFNLPDPSLQVINQAGSQTNSGWAAEETLDLEWAHAIAPGANILVVEAASQSIQSLLAAVNTARNTPGVVAISMSWGFNEMANETSYDSVFATPAGHQGITFLAASGDSGGFAGASYPASSPNVVAVGGTTLRVSASGVYESESAWNQSGGGYSQYEAEPSYQASVQSTGLRSTPDVAFVADPRTGVMVYQATGSPFQPSWQTVGGTSLGTPAWAAIIAIVDQGRALEGKGSLDGPTQTLPSLYALTSDSYHSVASTTDPLAPTGGWSLSPGLWGYFGTSTSSSGSAGGANTSTGLGSPAGPALVSGLTGSTITVPLTTITVGQGGTTAPSPIQPAGHGRKHRIPVRHGHRAVHVKKPVVSVHKVSYVPQSAPTRTLG